VRLHGWELGAVPGLVQTEAYAEAVVRARNPSGSAEAIERIVSARMERQELLSAEHPMLWYVIHEGVTRHRPIPSCCFGRSGEIMTNDVSWRKSSHSGGSGGNCVELASQGDRVLVRDTQQAGTGPVLTFSAPAWRRFVSRRRLVR
jgi:hypothetical protein